jgi:hypothetical protein
MSWTLWVVAALLAVAGVLYYMLARFLPPFIGLPNVGIGPRSYDLIVRRGQNVGVAWPFAVQDTSILLMVIVGFRIMN